MLQLIIISLNRKMDFEKLFDDTITHYDTMQCIHSGYNPAKGEPIQNQQKWPITHHVAKIYGTRFFF